MGVKTTKPISTISYNSPTFLRYKLSELAKAKLVAFWCFIPHRGEDDGEKDHIHVYIEPNRSTDTEEFRDLFRELDPSCEKPLGCMPFQKSQFKDWYLYGLHDPAYLRSKRLVRLYSYAKSDMVTSDPDYLEILSRGLGEAFSPYDVMLATLRDGGRFSDIVASGVIPIREIISWKTAWFELAAADRAEAFKLYRDVDPITGEFTDDDFPSSFLDDTT